MRLAWLRDYAAMPPDEDTPLDHFTTRTHRRLADRRL